jgi:hypothetical protein
MTDRQPALSGSEIRENGNVLYFAMMAAAAILLLLVFLLPASTVDGHVNPIYAEDGLIDFLSPLGYMACILLIVLLGGAAFALTRALPAVFLLLVLIMREYDFHTRFTSMSITKLKFYISGEVPLHEKLPAVIVLCIIAWAVLTLVRRYGRAFWAKLKKADPMCLAVAIAVALIVLSQAIDGIGRDFKMIGMPLGALGKDRFEALEETLEFGVPIFFLIAIIAYFGTARTERMPSLET